MGFADFQQTAKVFPINVMSNAFFSTFNTDETKIRTFTPHIWILDESMIQ